MPDYDQIVIHHAALDGSDDHLDTDDLRWMHVNERGWKDIGYSLVIEKVEGVPIAVLGRPWHQTPAHARGHNSHSLGVCLVGNFEEHSVPQDLLEKAADAVASLMFVAGITRIVRHCDLAATACPGKNFPWPAFVDMVEKRLGRKVRTR